jgi:hypothetical protein
MFAPVVPCNTGVRINNMAAADLAKSDDLMSSASTGYVIVVRNRGLESLRDASLGVNEFANIHVVLTGNPEVPVGLEGTSVEDK